MHLSSAITMNAQTYGIWMGTRALECNEYVIILLDTEGIDATTSTDTSDAGIPVATLLLSSSFFVYNSMGVPRKTEMNYI